MQSRTPGDTGGCMAADAPRTKSRLPPLLLGPAPLPLGPAWALPVASGACGEYAAG